MSSMQFQPQRQPQRQQQSQAQTTKADLLRREAAQRDRENRARIRREEEQKQRELEEAELRLQLVAEQLQRYSEELKLQLRQNLTDMGYLPPEPSPILLSRALKAYPPYGRTGKPVELSPDVSPSK